MEYAPEQLELKSKEKIAKKPPFLSRLLRQRGIRELAMAMTFFAAMSGKGVPAEHVAKIPKERQKQTAVLTKEEVDKNALHAGLGLRQKESANSETKPELGFYHRFTKEENGKLESNLPWALIAPLQVEFGSSITRKEQITFNIPFEFSRFFDSAKSLNSEDKNKVIEYIEDKMKQEIANKLIFLDFTSNTEKVYRAQHQKDLEEATRLIERAKIKGIKITGFASPEGPEQKGPSTLQPGAIDAENIKLAEKRAEDISPVLKEALSKMGLSPDAIAEIKAEESQFNDTELRDLDALATKSGVNGRDDAERLFNLVKDYNLNKFSENAELQGELNRIIGSKRKVEITIDFEGEEKKKVVVPIPNPLFLLLLRRRKREQSSAKPDQNVTETGPRPREIFTDGVVDFTKDLERNDSDFVKIFRDSGKNLSDADRKKMEEQAVLDDIDFFIDDSDAMRRGVDYRAMVEELSQVSDRYANGEQFEQGVAHVILTRWKEHDQRLRRELGIASDEGLDYHRSENQVLWSRFHARELIRLSRLDSKDLDTRFDARVAELELRRISRTESELPDQFDSGAETANIINMEGLSKGMNEWEGASDEERWKMLNPENDSAKIENKTAEKKLESAGKNQYDEQFTERAQAEEQHATSTDQKIAVEHTKTEAKPEERATPVEKSKETDEALRQRFAEVKQEILQKAREMSAAKERMETARKLGDKTSFLENQYLDAQKAWAEKDREYNELENKLKRSEVVNTTQTRAETDKKGKSVVDLETMENFVPNQGERLGAIKTEAVKVRNSQEQKWWSSLGWWKERVKGMATLGYLEVRHAEKMRASTKEAGKLAGRLGEQIKKIDQKDIQDAWEKSGIENPEEYPRFTQQFIGERIMKNRTIAEVIVNDARKQLEAKLKKYKDEFGKNIEKEKIDQAMEKLRNRLLDMQKGIVVADAKELTQIMRKNLDSNYWRRYIYGGIEAGLGFVGWYYWGAGKAAELWYGKIPAEAAAGKGIGGAEHAVKMLEDVPMNENNWVTSKEWLQEYGGIADPTDAQINLTDQILSKSNKIGVKVWDMLGSPMDTQMQQGHLLNFREVIQNLPEIVTLGK